MTQEELQLELEQQEASRADPGASSGEARKCWRERTKVHPAAELFPMMSDVPLDALAEDIAKNGLRQGVVLWTPEKPGSEPPKELYLLDGRNRLEAIERNFAADPEGSIEAITRALSWDADRGGTARLLYGDTDPLAVVVSLNLQRRQLSREDTDKVIADLLKKRPEWSDRKIAKLTARTDKTVGAARRRMEATAEIPQLDRRTGDDGKIRPSRRSLPQTESKTKVSPAQRRNITISDFAKLLRKQPADMLGDLTRLLADEQPQITELPRQKRIELAHGYLRALNVSVADLSVREGA